MFKKKKWKTNDKCPIADEEEITFPPTYRFERDTRDKYAYTKAKATGVRSPAAEVDFRVTTVTNPHKKTPALAGERRNVLNLLN